MRIPVNLGNVKNFLKSKCFSDNSWRSVECTNKDPTHSILSFSANTMMKFDLIYWLGPTIASFVLLCFCLFDFLILWDDWRSKKEDIRSEKKGFDLPGTQSGHSDVASMRMLLLQSEGFWTNQNAFTGMWRIQPEHFVLWGLFGVAWPYAMTILNVVPTGSPWDADSMT